MNEIKQRIRQFVTSNFYVPEPAMLADQDSLLDSGIVDSTGVLELIQFLEREFSIEVQDAEVFPENLDSVARMADFVGRKTARL